MRFLLVALCCLMAVGMWAQDINDSNDTTKANPEVASFKGDETSMTQRMVVQETLKFGYLSYDDVLHQMNGYHEAQQTIAALRSTYENELKRSEDIFSKQFTEYVDGQRNFPENILLKRQKELQQSMDQALQFKQEAKKVLEQKEKEVMDELKTLLNNAIQQVGNKHGFAFVLNTNNNACPFVNPAQGTDITEEVLQVLKKH